MTTKNANRPWISNYPPLETWLEKIEAHCQQQLPVGDEENHIAYLEKWITPSGKALIVEVYSNKMGWNIYTACDNGLIAATLTDAEKRLGI